MSDKSDQIKTLLNIPTVHWLREHLTCGRCCLLDWAVAENTLESFPDLCDRLVTNVTSLKASLQHSVEVDGKISLQIDCYAAFRGRVKLIDAFLRDKDGQQTDATLKQAILAVINATQRTWRWQQVSENQTFVEELRPQPDDTTDRRREPSFMSQLSSTRFKNLLRRIAWERPPAVDDAADGPRFPQFGWSHPGLQIAGEILAALSGDGRKPQARTTTRVMFAWEHPSDPQGILAEITVERLPGGCGLLIPDAYRCGYLNLAKSFSEGLQNALWAARNHAASNLTGSSVYDFDWRWSIDLLPAMKLIGVPESEKPILIPMGGRSAEVAFACAMIATHRDNPDNAGGIDPLDPHVGTTATIKSRVWGTDQLSGVSAVDVKTLLNPGYMRRRRLLEVVVAKSQDSSLIPTDETDNRFNFPQADSLAEAYELMSRYPRLTRGINRVLAKRANKLLQATCQPYVPPAIGEVVETHADRGDKAKPRLLEKWETEQLICGQLQPYSPPGDEPNDGHPVWVGNRVRIVAHSGLGKSVFILRCEDTIAKSDSGLLPLRLGRVTGNDASLGIIAWNAANPDDVIKGLADKFRSAADEYVREARQNGQETAGGGQRELNISTTQLRQWFAWMVTHGKVVFLLDALDQVKEHGVPGLGPFLGKGELRSCPVIMTGRPEVLKGRKEAFEENEHWRTLELQPFDEPRQRDYLGEELAGELIPQQDKITWEADREEIRRHQWKDLLEVPLLLSLLKEISAGHSARRKLQDIKSRYDLYQLAVDHLIDKGWASIEAERHENLLESKQRLREILGQVAWAMICRHDPTNFIEGAAYTTLQHDYQLNKDGKLKALQQVDLITAFQVLDRADEDGLAFRHRSFLEFFGGCHLMDRFEETDHNTGRRTVYDRIPDELRKQMLAEIHETCDSNGGLLPWFRKAGSDRPAMWKDTLRFALSHADPDRRSQLAIELIECGNPWVVYESIVRDHEKYPKPIDHLCRWLVHRDFPDWFDYRHAVSEVKSEGGTTVLDNARSATEQINLPSVTTRSTRDAASLYPLRELLPSSAGLYATISTEESLRERLTCLQSGESSWNFETSFVQLQGGTFDLSIYEDHNSIQPQQQRIGSFALSDFPVTNELFELFCPTHRRHRDQYSDADDAPAVHVNWFMATEFCLWLSELTGDSYRLPTEWEWEWACRWQNTRHEAYWWGPGMNDALCWYGGFGNGPAKTLRRARSRQEAISVFASANIPARHPSWESATTPGLLDMLGNVWEWCANPFDQGADQNDPGSSRVLRGGSWPDYADNCCSANRSVSAPVSRGGSAGFRVCRV